MSNKTEATPLQTRADNISVYAAPDVITAIATHIDKTGTLSAADFSKILTRYSA